MDPINSTLNNALNICAIGCSGNLIEKIDDAIMIEDDGPDRSRNESAFGAEERE